MIVDPAVDVEVVGVRPTKLTLLVQVVLEQSSVRETIKASLTNTAPLPCKAEAAEHSGSQDCKCRTV